MSLRFGHSEPQNNNNSHTNACMHASTVTYFFSWKYSHGKYEHTDDRFPEIFKTQKIKYVQRIENLKQGR